MIHIDRAGGGRFTLPGREARIAGVACAGIFVHLWLRWGTDVSLIVQQMPLYIVLAAGGAPLVLGLALKALRRQFGSDLLAGISIVTAVLLGEYLAGSLVVLMLSGGEALETFAVGRASSVLQALARRMPSVAHRHVNGQVEDIALDAVTVGDRLVVFPHEICPVDGVVVEGRGVMDESYLTGEPFMMPKAPGSQVLSGAINGDQALRLRASAQACGTGRWVLGYTLSQTARPHRSGTALAAREQVQAMIADSAMDLFAARSALGACARLAEGGGAVETETAMAKVLAETRWNRVKAAKLLKISYRALLYKIKQVGLEPEPISLQPKL